MSEEIKPKEFTNEMHASTLLLFYSGITNVILYDMLINAKLK